LYQIKQFLNEDLKQYVLQKYTEDYVMTDFALFSGFYKRTILYIAGWYLSTLISNYLLIEYKCWFIASHVAKPCSKSYQNKEKIKRVSF